jgi:hypothetical protein
MARITLRRLLDHAAEHDYGVPAFNINNMEQALAIMDVASKCDAPVIIQASRGARSYANDVMLRHMMDAVTEIYPQILQVHPQARRRYPLHERDRGNSAAGLVAPEQFPAGILGFAREPSSLVRKTSCSGGGKG